MSKITARRSKSDLSSSPNPVLECFIVEPSDIDEGTRRLLIKGDEAQHMRVLRIKEGEDILATNLVGTCYLAKLSSLSQPSKITWEAECEIISALHGFGESDKNVWLIQGMLSQPARWEFLLEKATEIGVKVIEPVETERTERSSIKRDRSDRVLKAAVKQTKRSNLPWLRELSTLRAAFKEAKDEKRSIFVLHESAPREESLKKALQEVGESNWIALAVGPEGGFSDEEVRMAREEFGAMIVSLGERRLRAETAAIAALSISIL